MTASIYHFFRFLVEHADKVGRSTNLERLDFDAWGFVSSRMRGRFPDLAIKINPDNDMFTGGELIEFKGSESMNVSSFNSTIPTGIKSIAEIIESPKIRKQMEDAGNHIDSMPYRDVYYLINSRMKSQYKVVLVHGSFFETIPVNRLIREAFLKVMMDANPDISAAELEHLSDLQLGQDMFSQVRRINDASVKIRFRIMTEVESKANILNSKIYPEIRPNTLNLCIPYSTIAERSSVVKRFGIVFGDMDHIRTLNLAHRESNDRFVLFQVRENM